MEHFSGSNLRGVPFGDNSSFLMLLLWDSTKYSGCFSCRNGSKCLEIKTQYRDHLCRLLCCFWECVVILCLCLVHPQERSCVRCHVQARWDCYRRFDGVCVPRRYPSSWQCHWGNNHCCRILWGHMGTIQRRARSCQGSITKNTTNGESHISMNQFEYSF